ncbi:hypothetical protein [Trinickia mobilis]|uniref:hypothetical protein n=1 Tax=Trinickia mobilis TaxID=2816356 RepID=UPI001A8CED2E|nr:hypothetical protein [Trinickia mobilis]
MGNTNCIALDAAPGNATTPAILGVCPDGAGHPTPVVWTPTGLLGAYVASVPGPPANSVSCAASQINATGQILGTCDFGSGIGTKTVRWPSANGAAVVLSSVAGSPRSVGVEMNASGAIVGQYLSAGDVSLPFYWNPDANVVQAIPALASGAAAAVSGISDTGVVMGDSEIDAGTSHAFKWTAASGVTDLGTLAGGNNSSVSMTSNNGCFATGNSEVAGHANHAFADSLCVPSSAERAISTLASLQFPGIGAKYFNYINGYIEHVLALVKCPKRNDPVCETGRSLKSSATFS